MANPIQSNGPWSYYRYNSVNCAQSAVEIPVLDDGNAVTVSWEFEAGAAIRSSPCMNGFNQVGVFLVGERAAMRHL
jgi:hypothetical protein